jgi:H+-transporting ATPase
MFPLPSQWDQSLKFDISFKDFPKAQEILRDGWKTRKFTPFDPVSKRITAEVVKDGKKYTCAKGAPNA